MVRWRPSSSAVQGGFPLRGLVEIAWSAAATFGRRHAPHDEMSETIR